MTPGTWAAANRPQRPVLFVNPRSGGGKAARAGLAERARERGIDVIVLRPRRQAPGAGRPGRGRRRGRARGRRRRRIARRRQRRSCTGFPSSAFPPAPETTSRSTSASTRRSRRLARRVHRRRRALDRRGGGERPPLPQQRLARDLRRRRSAAGVPRRQGAHARADGRAGARTERAGSRPPVADDRGRAHRDPAVVLVSNNPYSFEPPRAPGTRPALDSGQLGSSCSTGRPPARARGGRGRRSNSK